MCDGKVCHVPNVQPPDSAVRDSYWMVWGSEEGLSRPLELDDLMGLRH